MTTALEVLLLLGILGACDTIYYHEWRLQLPGTPTARRELRLHASRDFAYAIVFGSLAWITWNGLWVWPLAAILGFEVGVTLTDFIEEDRTRKLPAGERVMHALMGIVYGVFLALLFPMPSSGDASTRDSARPIMASFRGFSRCSRRVSSHPACAT